jgi:hypothetical protein
MDPKDNGAFHDEIVYEAEPGFKTVFHIVFWGALGYLAFVFI